MVKRKDTQGLSEEEFLRQYNPNDYIRPSVTTDLLIVGVARDYSSLKVLLVKRAEHPFIDSWALPGGFVQNDETAHCAANRIMESKTHLRNVYLDQIYTFTKPDRDPRMRVMSIAYLSLICEPDEMEESNKDDEAWFNLSFTDDSIELSNKELNARIVYRLKKESFKNGAIKYENFTASLKSKQSLAFDHIEIVIEGIKRLREQVFYGNQAFCLVEKTFTLPELQLVYELILNRPLYKKSFRDMVSSKIFETGGEKKSRVAGGRKSKEYIMKER